jgi:hypothetical protein
MKKLMLGLVPLLAVAAFAAMPAMAAASTTEYGTGTTPFTKATEVTSKGTTFKLIASGEEIECKALSDTGTDENVSGVGKSTKETLTFSECKINTGALKGCEVASTATTKTIVGAITNEVKSATEVEIKVTAPGFAIVTTGSPAGCPKGTSVGTVEGHATGKQAAGSNVLVFSAATGLTLSGEAATITGEDATVTKTGSKPVVIV